MYKKYKVLATDGREYYVDSLFDLKRGDTCHIRNPDFRFGGDPQVPYKIEIHIDSILA